MGLLVMSKQFNSRKEMEADAQREDRALSRSKSKALKKQTRSADRDQDRKHKAYNEAQEVMRRVRNS